MAYLFVGAGQAGGAIVDDVFARSRMATLGVPFAFNSTIRDLQNLSNIPSDLWYGISETDGLVQGTEAGFEERVTGGFGRNPQRADEIMEQYNADIIDIFADHLGEDESVPFAFVFLGLGGGTGCGIAPHVIESVKAFAGTTTKVIVVAVLPNTLGPVQIDEEREVSAGRQAKNAEFGLERLESLADGIILVDNQRLGFEDAAEGRFSEYNRYVADAIVDLISGPVLEQIDPSQYEDIDVPVVDIQDIVTSLNLEGGETGYATLGRSVMMTKTLPGYLIPWVGRKEVDAAALARIAGSKQTIAGIDPEDAKKAISIVRCPASYISHEKYRLDTSVVRRYFQMHCPEVNIGLTLTRRNLVSCTALFTYDPADIKRLDEIDQQAGEYEKIPA